MEGSYRQKEWDKQVKRVDYFRQSHPPLGEEGVGGVIRQIISLGLTRKFQTNCFKIPLLGEALTAIKLGIKS